MVIGCVRNLRSYFKMNGAPGARKTPNRDRVICRNRVDLTAIEGVPFSIISLALFVWTLERDLWLWKTLRGG